MSEYNPYQMRDSSVFDELEEKARYNKCKDGFSNYVLEVKGGEEAFIPNYAGAYDVRALNKDVVKELNKLIDEYNAMTTKYHYSIIGDHSFVQIMKWSIKESVAHRALSKFVKEHNLKFYSESTIEKIATESSQEM